MKNIIMIFLIIISFLTLINSSIVINTVIYSINLFINNIFPSLFPFFVLSDLLINYGFVDFIAKVFKPLMNNFFKVNSNCAFIFVMSMISGFPSSAKYIKDMYLNGNIDELEASKVLTFTHFSNPLFIMGAISISFLNNKKAAILILIIHYLSNFIVGFLFRNIIMIDINNNKINNNISIKFSEILKKSIKNSFDNLILIFGTIITFLILTNLFNDYLNLNIYCKSILSGLLEMTGGISNISVLPISIKNKTTIIGMFISFGGISIHMQIKSILANTKIKYHYYLIARILHSAICGILIYLLFDYVI